MGYEARIIVHQSGAGYYGEVRDAFGKVVYQGPIRWKEDLAQKDAEDWFARRFRRKTSTEG